MVGDDEGAGVKLGALALDGQRRFTPAAHAVRRVFVAGQLVARQPAKEVAVDA